MPTRILVFCLALSAAAGTGLAAPAGGGAENPFAAPATPPARQPFTTQVVAAPETAPAGAETSLRLRITVPPEHWLYRERTYLEVLPASHYSVVAIEAPAGEIKRDPFLDEDVEVYKHDTEFTARLRASAGGDVTAVLHYQGCNDKFCFFPTADTLRVALQVAGSVTATPTDAAAEPRSGFQERLSGFLQRHFANPFLALGVVAVLGLLSAATPCVYPMIPITARILLGRGGGNAALGRTHAAFYGLGIVTIYALLGFIAAATGGGFNTVMRSPVVILGVAILFAILGLSMLGLFEIQLPAALASRVDSGTSKRGGLFGTWLMGVGAGLVVSPCVGPVVVFVLTQIAAQVAAAEASGGGAFATTTPLLYGAYLMAGYGAGLAIPFWLVGLFSARTMARPGGWMVAVRVVLGLVILYFAYDSFLKGMETASVPRDLSRWMVVGVVSIFLAVYWGAFRTKIEDGPHAGWQKVRLACSIVLLVAGVFFLWTSLSRSGLVGGSGAEAATALASPAGGFEDSHGLRWHRDLAAASAEARERDVPLFVDFYADWCANCKVFAKQAAAAGPLRNALESVVRVKVYDTDAVYKQFVSDARYPELKVGLPFFVILSSGGELLWKGNDYRAHSTFIREIERARTRERA